jgi:hypothetical protein
MLIPVTIVLTQSVYEIEIYDHQSGSDKPLYKGRDLERGAQLDIGSVISKDDCSPPEGFLDIKAILDDSHEAWREYPYFRVVEGRNDWLPAAKAEKAKPAGGASEPLG